MTPEQSELAKLLEPFPWQAFATLTTPYQRSRIWWDTALHQWWRAVQSSERKTLAGVLGYELQPIRHAHLLLTAMAPLDCETAGLRWLPIAATRRRDSAVVLPYDPTRGALGYVCKLYGTFEDDVRLIGRLESFCCNLPQKPMKARDRRRLKRMQDQRPIPPSSFL